MDEIIPNKRNFKKTTDIQKNPNIFLLDNSKYGLNFLSERVIQFNNSLNNPKIKIGAFNRIHYNLTLEAKIKHRKKREGD